MEDREIFKVFAIKAVMEAAKSKQKEFFFWVPLPAETMSIVAGGYSSVIARIQSREKQ